MNASVRNRPVLWDIVGEFDSLLDQIVRPVGRTASPTSANATSAVRSPAIDVTESDSAYELVADMPGVSRENLNITIEKGVLTISSVPADRAGETDAAEADAAPGARMIRRERRGGEYSRTLQLAEDVAEEYVSAALTDGVLHLTLPKLQKPEPRKIDVNVS